MKLEIYQAKEECKWKFRDWETFKRYEETGVHWSSDYELKYCKYDFPDDMDLELIYCAFNQDDRPNPKTMHSVSVSDIIVMNDVPYYVDSIGFKEMTDLPQSFIGRHDSALYFNISESPFQKK